MLVVVPVEQAVVRVLWLLVYLLRDIDVEGLVRSLTIVLCPEYLTHVCAALNSGLKIRPGVTVREVYCVALRRFSAVRSAIPLDLRIQRRFR